jgi:hypothetical protein
VLVEQLLSEKRDTVREKQEAIVAITARHRAAIANLCQRHSESMSQKDALLKESDGLVQGIHYVFGELLNEMHDTKVTQRQMNSQKEPHNPILYTWSKSFTMTV